MKIFIKLLLILCSFAGLSAMEEQTDKQNNQIIRLLNKTGHTLKLDFGKLVSRGTDGGWIPKKKQRIIATGEAFQLRVQRTKKDKEVKVQEPKLSYRSSWTKEEVIVPIDLIQLEAQGQDITVQVNAAGIGNHNLVLDLDNMSIAKEVPSQLQRLILANETINHNIFVRYSSRRMTEKNIDGTITNRYPIEKAVITVITPNEEYPIVVAKEITNGDENRRITKRTEATKIEVALAFDTELNNNRSIANPSSITGWVEVPLTRIKRISRDSQVARLSIERKSKFLLPELEIDLKHMQTYSK